MITKFKSSDFTNRDWIKVVSGHENVGGKGTIGDNCIHKRMTIRYSLNHLSINESFILLKNFVSFSPHLNQPARWSGLIQTWLEPRICEYHHPLLMGGTPGMWCSALIPIFRHQVPGHVTSVLPTSRAHVRGRRMRSSHILNLMQHIGQAEVTRGPGIVGPTRGAITHFPISK